MEAKPVASILRRDNYLVTKYLIFGFLFTAIIGIFSLIMTNVARQRSYISDSNYESAGRLYNGPLAQASPTVNALSDEDEQRVYKYDTAGFELTTKDVIVSDDEATKYAENTALLSTNGQVVMTADYVKKGLSYQPTYRTEFKADYVLKNSLAETSIVTFEFPFPFNTSDSEISNAALFVDGVAIPDTKATLDLYKYDDLTDYDDYYYEDQPTLSGLRWSGEIPANGQVVVTVTYNTVGLAEFTYEGLENPKGAQDFKFVTTIKGIRKYNVVDGLTVDQKDFAKNQVTLTWDKKQLYSKPLIDVEIGEKLNPSRQVARVYTVMLPLYLVAMTILLFLCYKFGKKLSVFDMFLVTLLYILYFPLVHYLSSFTIDPTIEVFAAFENVGYFSMPLYGAFAVAWLLVGGMIYYLIGRLSGFGFATKFAVPSLVLFLGFFPLVLTVPEYSILLTLIGVTALLAIIIQSRLRLQR